MPIALIIRITGIHGTLIEIIFISLSNQTKPITSKITASVGNFIFTIFYYLRSERYINLIDQVNKNTIVAFLVEVTNQRYFIHHVSATSPTELLQKPELVQARPQSVQ